MKHAHTAARRTVAAIDAACLILSIISACAVQEILQAQESQVHEPREMQTETEEDAAGTKITVCVLDSGCSDGDAKGKNYLDSSDDLTDAENHGALVCRIIQEEAPEADIYILKCFSSSEESSGTAIQEALRDAVDIYHADLINMSWTLNKESEELHDAVKYAALQGAVLIASSGNLTPSTLPGSMAYPASFEEVIGVSGADVSDEGEPEDSLWYLHNESVFVSADGNYEGKRGSSFAAPRVTGVLARHFALSGESVSMENAEEYLKSTAEDAGAPGYDTTFGWGYIRSGLRDGKP